jgi:xylulokinase
LYLGLDSSTQSLTAIVIDVDGARRAVVFEHTIAFDSALPEYGTHHGVMPSPDPHIAVSPPLMWADALDRMLAAVAAGGLDLTGLRAISGSAQQHGSVYLNDRADPRLAALDPTRPLADQIEGIFSRAVAPIWMDSSTADDCHALTSAMGGPLRLAELTGSRAFERFTGPQIHKFAHAEPAAWASTDRVHLVSSFMASLLSGTQAPLDPGDASGMNLMDLKTHRWLPEALEATAPGLADRLPPIVPSSQIVSRLSPYWQQRHGLPPARVVAWSGDNSCTLVGTGLVREGQLTVSLGTSDTVCGLLRTPRVDPSGTGHVFSAPTGDYMALICFKNGSLARERIRDRYAMDWAAFSTALQSTRPGNDGGLLVPWFEPEITPDVPTPGVHRVDLEPDDGPRNVRAVVEAQMMAMVNHSRWMHVDVDVLHATGGAAANTEILQVMADVFGAEVRRFDVGNAACLGAALRAFHADALADGHKMPWEDVVSTLAEPRRDSSVRPRPEHRETYRALRQRFAELTQTLAGRRQTHRTPASRA